MLVKSLTKRMITGKFKADTKEFDLPEGFMLDIEETSNSVYRINLIDSAGRSVGNHGSNLDSMIEQALEDLIKISR